MPPASSAHGSFSISRENPAASNLVTAVATAWKGDGDASTNSTNFPAPDEDMADVVADNTRLARWNIWTRGLHNGVASRVMMLDG